MRLVVLDFETYWSADYSLSKMSPLEYVMDDRFELISMAIKVDHHYTDVFFGHDKIQHVLSKLAELFSDAIVVAHNNSGFDSYVLAYRLGVRPKMWGCTLAMARPIHAKTCGLSLAALVKHYELGEKNNAALINTRGKRLADFTQQELADMETYNRDDVEQCYGIFHILKSHYKPSELWQIDALIRMRTEPAFELDVPLLEKTIAEEGERKQAALLDLSAFLGLDTFATPEEAAENVRAELASAPRFAALLESFGVDTPMKPSPTNPEKMIPALAKTDEAFLALQDSDSEPVAAAARARLDVKSTLLETRAQKFLTAARLAGGRLPVPIRYCGADTTGRDSGEEYNPQNLPRINPKQPKPSDALRNSLRAPKGKMVIVADQSGIELRVNHFLWKVEDSMELYQASPDKADLYRAFAAPMYGIDPAEIDAIQRQLGKVAQLGLGFGSGPATFQRIAKTMGGLDIPVHAVGDEIAADRVVRMWRARYYMIVAGWKRCGAALKHIALGAENQVDDWGLVHTSKEGFVLPSGRIIRYPDLRQEADGEWDDGRAKTSWMYAHGRHKARITGPKATENIVQALARDSIFDCSVEYYRRTGLRPALRVHDELVYVVDESPAQDLLDELQGVLRTPPKWWPELVVWSEGDVAHTYGAAK